MSQPLHTPKYKNSHVVKPKVDITSEAAAKTYQKGWEVAFDLMESYFSEKRSLRE